MSISWLTLSQCSPSIDDARRLFQDHFGGHEGFNTLPVSLSLPAPDTLTPVVAYLRLTQGAKSEASSFLLESVLPGSTQGRFSFVGTGESCCGAILIRTNSAIADPQKVIRVQAGQGDPLIPLQQELSAYSILPLPPASSHLIPPFRGGAVGYVAYDSIYSFERVLKTNRPQKDDLDIPDAFFILADVVVVFDHLFGSVSVWTHVRLDQLSDFDEQYSAAVTRLQRTADHLAASDLPLPDQPVLSDEPSEAVSNVGKEGYTGFVRKLRDEHILNGDIIQAVPSQRLSRKTKLHPFNAYRYLRRVNPSPYMFYVDCKLSDSPDASSVHLVGASPECLLSITPNRVVTNHAIAGTIRRGMTPEEDASLADELFNSVKDRAEHVMLVDLARNDINRVCKPATVHVKELMKVERFSHVMHLTSTVEGELRQGLDRWDAFRSIFPAGTVSGAPKIKAMELIASMEPSTRGVYAGAVGRWNLGKNTDECDTCIAIRTMLFKDGVVYLQAGGGIVWDSNEEEEYQETVNKLAANVRTLEKAEQFYAN